MTVTNTAETLDVMSFPLHGARLIEASAGTGKTYTITGLYLRLLLGHGDDSSRFERILTVDQILVVTFTEAATEELKDRIRSRIHQARIAFLRGQTDDGVLQPLLDDYPDHQQAASLLLNAERQMDEAAVFTIHGFCKRMLTQNAFESGASFQQEFVSDEDPLKLQVVSDYWRRNFYPLSLSLAQTVRSYWSSPSALYKEVGRYLSGAEITLTAEPLQGGLDTLHQENLARIAALKQAWAEHCDDFVEIFSQSGIKKNKYSSRYLPSWLKSVSEWALSATHDYKIDAKLEKFSQQVLIEASTAGNAPQHPVFALVEEFLAQPVDLRPALIAHVIKECRIRLKQEKERLSVLSFDDLLTQLSAAIDADESAALVEKIRDQYPVAMIDEFQDTDPLQYNIFGRIYLPEPSCGLFMIGDPKQAIYGFRGADIFTYIEAKKQVLAHYTLGTNWRSTAAMVESVNQVFSLPDNAFIYDEDIPFLPVQSYPGAQQKSWWFAEDGQTPTQQSALNFWLLGNGESLVTQKQSLPELAEVAANQIYHLLSAAQHGKAYFAKDNVSTDHFDKDNVAKDNFAKDNGNNGTRQDAIQAGDIAVLVRDRTEARSIRKALSERGIASVYLSNRDSVFGSAVASDIWMLLQAALSPEDDRKLRACLASPLFGLEIAHLDQLNVDENAWESAVVEFKEYRNVWMTRGVQPMLRSVMSKRHIAEQLVDAPEGERRLTDLMHMTELLQQASLEIDSAHGLLRWLAQKIERANEPGNADEHNQRLESEANLVQVITIHKSKGLEYPLVFVPFACNFKTAKEGKYYDTEKQTTVLDIRTDKTAQAQAKEKAEQERLAEDLRLLYVALTRAVYGCYLGLAPLTQGRKKDGNSSAHLSAMGYLLQNGEEGNSEALLIAVNRLISEAETTTLQEPLAWDEQKFVPLDTSHETLFAKELNQPIERSWRVTSYSNLAKFSSHTHQVQQSEPVLDESGLDIDAYEDKSAQAESLVAEERSIFNFPRGARPGTFLHTLFEQVDFNQPANSDENQATVTKLLALENLEPEWQPVLTQLVDDVLLAPLDEHGLRLADVPAPSRLVEMEFLLPIALLNASEVNRLVKRYDPLSAQAGELGFKTVQGMIKGFIDLVFEHQGRYYVLDWKSNHLGDSSSDYHPDALAAAMADHRYDLQYQIYSLALHRFLASRIVDYDYQQHFGGVYYIFLRGVNQDEQRPHGIFYHKSDQRLIEQLDALAQGQLNPPQDSDASRDTGQMELDW